MLLGYLAAITERVELATGVLALPQRQTVLVAKQAAEIDVLSGGRLRLGIGLGWVEPEFRALNEDFTDRGRRVEEQITIVRALLTQEVVTLHGRWHHIDAMGSARCRLVVRSRSGSVVTPSLPYDEWRLWGTAGCR